MSDVLLDVRDLTVRFGTLAAVDGVSFRIGRGRIVGLVGESGSGKSATAGALLRLHDPSVASLSGDVMFDGKNILSMGERELCGLRGRRISMVFQDPMAALNPRQRIGVQLCEAMALHGVGTSAGRMERASHLLARLGVPAPEERLRAYPHELSGGLRQRVVIAMALAAGPELIVADEPTTALDVTVQAQVLEIFRTLQREDGLGVLLITHDLGVVSEVCDDVVVMYAGRVMESGPAREVLTRPAHPYTVALLASMPRAEAGRMRLREIPGLVPDLRSPPPGCRFAPRCERAARQCHADSPHLTGIGRQHACWLPLEEVA